MKLIYSSSNEQMTYQGYSVFTNPYKLQLHALFSDHDIYSLDSVHKQDARYRRAADLHWHPLAGSWIFFLCFNYNNNTLKTSCSGEDVQESSRISSISFILTEIHILKVGLPFREMFSSCNTFQLHLLDSLVPDTDKIPETVRIPVLQRAVQKNHDLRQIHVLDSVWSSKTGCTGNFTLEVYYDMLT